MHFIENEPNEAAFVLKDVMCPIRRIIGNLTLYFVIDPLAVILVGR